MNIRYELLKIAKELSSKEWKTKISFGKEWTKLRSMLGTYAEELVTEKDIEEFMKALKDKFLDRSVLYEINDKDKEKWIKTINDLIKESKSNNFEPLETIEYYFDRIYDIADDNGILISTTY